MELHTMMSEKGVGSYVLSFEHRDYCPLRGADEPSGPVVEVHTPGETIRITWASTKGEALDRMRSLIADDMGATDPTWKVEDL